MNEPTKLRSSGAINDTDIHLDSVETGQPADTANNTEFTIIESAPAIIISTPAALFAGYQMLGDDIVFGVLKPYNPLGGTFPRTIGIERRTMMAGTM